MRYPILIVGMLLSAVALGQVRGVSLVQLIAFPERYVGMTVQVKGYYADVGGGRLFLSEEHARSRDVLSSVAVTDRSEVEITGNCQSRNVSITGVFTFSHNLYQLRDIQKITGIDGKPCWP